MTKKEQKQQRIDALENIRNQIAKVEMAKNRRKTAAEMLSDHLEANQLYKAVELAKTALSEAKEKLFNDLASDDQYIGLKDSFDDAKYTQGIEEETLAAEVLAYREEFEAQTVQIDEESERPIIIKASLGKKQDLQMDLFDEMKEAKEQKELGL